MARRASDRSISNVTHVIQGGVPETIAAYANEKGIDPIAMPTQGRTGIEEALTGSVTERASIPSVVKATERNVSVADAIREYAAANDVDLVVMGTHGRAGIERYLLGSVTEKVVRTVSIPVLTVPERESP